MLNVLYQDVDYVAVDKPSGMLVHPTSQSSERESCLSALRDQIGAWVYPIHRLDRATSGVLLFALSPEAVAAFAPVKKEKKYFAVVRGYASESGTINKPLRAREDKPLVSAITHFKCSAHVELPHAVGRYSTSRYSLVDVEIETGRLHQIRKHFSGISHHLIGDTVYGDGRHNRLFREKFAIHRLLLVAKSFAFEHPRTSETVCVEAPWPQEFLQLSDAFSWSGVISPRQSITGF